MSVKIIVPTLGESVTEGIIASWVKKKGESVKVDDLILELETDKVTLEVNATAEGVIEELLFNEGDTVEVGTVLGSIKEGTVAAGSEAPKKEAPAATSSDSGQIVHPSAQKMAKENNVDTAAISGSGKAGRVTKGDVMGAMSVTPAAPVSTVSEKRVERVRMSGLRKRIAQRLKESQNTAAILTTFNEVDMTNVIEMRKKYKDAFEKKHGTKLGFMSFFVKAAIHALKEVPAVNAEIDGDEVVYKNFYDISVAVGTPQGLVVPVVRDADKLSFAGTEAAIRALGVKARDGKLTVNDMTGGTFTISNGGVYGSLLSTPIINPPQSGILGMHKMQERPMVINGEIKIRQMMYLALSYDHRIIDGKEAVTFLVKIKEAIEDPERLLLDM